MQKLTGRKEFVNRLVQRKDNEAHLATIKIPKEIFGQYVNGIFTKTVREARNKDHLLKAKAIADELALVGGGRYGLIYDKRLTGLEPEEDDGTTLAGIWFGPLPDGQAHVISKKYHLYV